MAHDGELNARLEALRAAFDEGFSKAPDTPAETRNLLILSAGGERFALPLEGIAAVERATPLTPLPSSHPALLGLTNCRGRIVPVFSLAVLLGKEATRVPQSPGTTPPPCEVFALAALDDAQRVMFGFERLLEFAQAEDELDGLSRSSLYRTSGGVVPILDLADLLTRVTTPFEET